MRSTTPERLRVCAKVSNAPSIEWIEVTSIWDEQPVFVKGEQQAGPADNEWRALETDTKGVSE